MEGLRYDRPRLELLCRNYHVTRLAVFGSKLRGTARSDSDLDLLIEFESGKAPGLIRFFDLEVALGDLFQQPVELSTPGFLDASFREDVKRHAQPLYTR